MVIYKEGKQRNNTYQERPGYNARKFSSLQPLTIRSQLSEFGGKSANLGEQLKNQ